MNQSKQVVKVALAVLLIGGVGNATADTINGTATATVITPVTVTEATPLTFGSFAVGPTGGTVVLSTAGAVSNSGDVELVSASTTSAATFTISGQPSTAISVSLNTAGAQLDDGSAGGGGSPMTLGSFTDSGLPTTTDATGSATFNVGATLNVNGSQAPGSYSTSTGDGVPYTVTVSYN